MRNISLIIRQELVRHHDAKKAKWLENYVKHDIKSLGIGIPQIRSIVQRVYNQNKLNELSLSKQKKLLNELIQREYAEEKLAAIIYVQLYLKDTDVKFQLSMISSWFDKRWVYDWNICDWLCVRLLSPLVDKYPKQTIRTMQNLERASESR